MINIKTLCREGVTPLKPLQCLKTISLELPKRIFGLDENSILESTKFFDLMVMIQFPLLATLISYFFNTGFVFSMFLFLFLPSIYLTIRHKASVKKSVSFSMIMGVPLAIIIDYMMEISNAWVLDDSILGDLRLFDFVFYEQIPWLFIFAYFVVMFYRHFVGEADKSEFKTMPLSWLLIWHTFLFAGFVLFWIIDPQILNIQYAYLNVGIVFSILPLSYILFRYPKLLKRFIFPTVYFFYFSLIYEMISLHLGHWSFPNTSQFLGYISIFGHSFPYEELTFWIILGPASCLAYFELFGGETSSSKSNL